MKFQALSIKARITLMTVLLFTSSTWALIYAVSARLERELAAVLSAQQFAVASYVAEDIEANIRFRFSLLTKNAARVTPAMLSNPAAAEDFLRTRDALNELFKIGIVLVSRDGHGIADYPYIPARRDYRRYHELEYFKGVMATGLPAMGEPSIGRVTKLPILAMAAPIRNAKGEIVAVLAGYTSLSDQTLFGNLEKMTVGSAGYFAIDDPKHQVIVSSSDPRRMGTLAPLAKPGVNAMLDRFLAGYEGTGIAVNSRGVETLTSGKRIPTTGWIVQAVMPTAEAFAPVRNLRTTSFSLAAVISLLVALLAWVIVRRSFRPIDQATEAILAMTDDKALPVAASNEVGRLLESFNRLVAQRNLAEENTRRLATVFVSSNEAILITDAQNRIIEANPAFSRMTGYDPQEVLGKDPKILSAGRTPIEVYREMWADLDEKGNWQGELWDRRKTGEAYPKWLSISVVRDSGGNVANYIGSFIDITERKASEEKIRHLAYHDVLTNLPNRLSLYERLEQALHFARRHRTQLALMLIDLDHFKNINDTLGHHAGDELLIEVAQRIAASLRESDIVARLGGDEFVVVVPDLTPDDVARIAENIVRTVSEPYWILGHELTTSPSIGICLFPDNAVKIEDLLRSADIAMYHAKTHGRGSYQFFSEEMDVRTRERQAMESDLRSAIEERQFELHYQPQLDLRSGRISGVEALVRWRHPQRGMVSPMEFIPLAEELGLINPLGDWILDEACRQLAAWRAGGLLDLCMSINLSARQFLDHGLPERIHEVLERTGLPAGMVDLEITESASMESPVDAVALMRRLTVLGVSLSIDDFGTGYSSLAYLKLFPIHTLKIDRSFVKDIETDPNDAGICDVTVLLAHKLGLEVVAEGVETDEQLTFLRSIGCERIQGYWLSKPLPANEAEQFIRNRAQMREIGTVDLWPAG
jgi:diguanylate cyclase (GGDEF)-like protein/PAS domain S-box-containing protein